MVNKKYIRCDVIKEIDILYIIVFSLLFILKLDINFNILDIIVLISISKIHVVVSVL